MDKIKIEVFNRNVYNNIDAADDAGDLHSLYANSDSITDIIITTARVVQGCIEQSEEDRSMIDLVVKITATTIQEI